MTETCTRMSAEKHKGEESHSRGGQGPAKKREVYQQRHSAGSEGCTALHLSHLALSMPVE